MKYCRRHFQFCFLFLQASVVYTYECTDGSVIVASDPELVGQLLHRTVDPVNAKGENTPIRLMTCQDLCSLWGIATSTAPPQAGLGGVVPTVA